MDFLPLTVDDLIPDEPLSRTAAGPIPDALDTLNHRATAHRVAELAVTSKGHLNVALFGPWGSGKSSFYGLVRDQLATLDSSVQTIHFDAWKNSGPGFQTNFLSSVAAEISGADQDVSSRLFKTTSSVNLPFGASITTRRGRRTWWLVVAAIFVVLFIVVPTAWTAFLNVLDSEVSFWQLLAVNLGGWAGFAASGSVLFVIVSLFLDLSRVTVQESTPSHISQFSQLFNELMQKQKRTRYVIFIDELDRCRPEDVMTTLEGLRTFLGHEKCVFIVAFDREAVATTISHHLQNEVPVRPSRPYYSTSGEYLDKIFQFQVSLPPQPVHTFRRFALALVKDKGGVWGQLRTRDERQLDRVVRILSPMHVTSPRRTKVLLNDFAMNARILESSNFRWLDRAEEIAALTVIQTEFPNFAAHLELEPALLGCVASETRPPRESIRRLYDLYSKDGKAELDEVVKGRPEPEGTIDDGVTPSESGPSDGEAVASQLNSNLHRFLRKLKDMGCRLPMADLILMHSDGNLLSFDDLTTYNALLGATDAPRADTLSILKEASESDRALALTYLLEHVEGAQADEAEDLVILAGAAANTLNGDIVKAASEFLRSAWDQVVGRSTDVLSKFDVESISGYVKALVHQLEPDELERAYDEIEANHQAASASAFLTLLDAIPASDLGKHSYLARIAITLSREHPDALAHFFDVHDGAALPPLSAKLGNLLAEEFTTEVPEEVEATTPTVAARTIAAEANEAAQAEYLNRVDTAREAMSDVLSMVQDWTVDGTIKSWLLQVLREIGDTDEWAYEVHDDLIRANVARGLEGVANDELLVAISRRPWKARTRWVDLLVPTAEVNADLLSEALRSLFSRGASSKQSAKAAANAADNAFAIASLLHDGDVNTAPLAASVQEILDRGPALAEIESDYRIAMQLSRALDLLPESRGAATHLASRAIEGLIHRTGNEDEYGYVLIDIAAVPLPVAKAVEQVLLDGLPSTAVGAYTPRVRSILAAQKRSQELGGEVSPLSDEPIRLALENGLSLNDVMIWVESGPPASCLSELSADVDLLQVPVGSWRLYSARVGPLDRGAAWLVAEHLGASLAVLTAIANSGVSEAFYLGRASAVENAKTSVPKTKAVSQFRTLPTGNRLAAVGAIQIASYLANKGTGKKTDVPLVVGVLTDNHAQITASEKADFRKFLGPWLDSGQAYARKQDISKLQDLGLAPRDESVIGRIARNLGGSKNSR